MLALDRPSDASRYDYNRLHVEQPEAPAWVSWVKKHGKAVRAAFDAMPEGLPDHVYTALRAADDAVCDAEAAGFKEGWL